MKKFFVIGAAAAAVLFASAPGYAGIKINGAAWNGLGINGIKINGFTLNALGQNALGQNGFTLNTHQASAAGQPGLNLTFDGVTLPNGDTIAAK
jgi:hypothetical protein